VCCSPPARGQGAIVARTKAIGQLKALIVNAPEALRDQLRRGATDQQLDRCARLRALPTHSVEHRATVCELALLEDPPLQIKNADLVVGVAPSQRRRTLRRRLPRRPLLAPALTPALAPSFPDRSPIGRPGWNLITALEARLPLATTRPASTGRDRSACASKARVCIGPLPVVR
jgi:hypothetical protein